MPLYPHLRGILAGLGLPAARETEGSGLLAGLLHSGFPFRDAGAAAMEALGGYAKNRMQGMRDEYLEEDPTLARAAITGIPEGAVYAADLVGGGLGLKRGLTKGLQEAVGFAPVMEDALNAGFRGLATDLAPSIPQVRPSYRGFLDTFGNVRNWSHPSWGEHSETLIGDVDWGHATPYASRVWESGELLPRRLQPGFSPDEARHGLGGGPSSSVSLAPLDDAEKVANEMARMHALNYAKTSDEADQLLVRWVNEDIWDNVNPEDMSGEVLEDVRESLDTIRTLMRHSKDGNLRQEAYIRYLALRDSLLHQRGEVSDLLSGYGIDPDYLPKNPGFVDGPIPFDDPNPQTVQVFPVDKGLLKYVDNIYQDPAGAELAMAQNIPLLDPAYYVNPYWRP